MEGIVVVNKPNGLTSHDVVAKVRRKFNMKRVGHAGTLDPMATGVLVVLLGKTTKLFDKFVSFDKGYRATMVLGMLTDTADTCGKTIEKRPYDNISEEQFQEVLLQFKGEIEQVPPMFSALKFNGKKLYELARQGIEVERKPRRVHIYRLEMEVFNPPNVQIYMECSKGTYVRQLAEDIGKALGCGACISQIERTQVGQFNIDDSISLEELNESHIRDWKG